MNIPLYLLRILIYIYDNQSICISWNGIYSQSFTTSNGIRQGSVLSPWLFNIYMNDLSVCLNQLNCGCMINNLLFNHILYADDIVLLCPCYKGMQKLIDICDLYSKKFDITFNVEKTKCLYIRPPLYKRFEFPSFSLNNKEIEFVPEYKYLGHIITDDISDNADIARQTSLLYARGNVLIRNFDKCSLNVKIKLFMTYICNIYCSYLWVHYRVKPWNDIRIAYNNLFRKFFHIPRHINNVTVSVSEAMHERDIPCFAEVANKCVSSFVHRIYLSDNSLFASFMNSDFYFLSPTLSVWRNRNMF